MQSSPQQTPRCEISKIIGCWKFVFEYRSLRDSFNGFFSKDNLVFFLSQPICFYGNQQEVFVVLNKKLTKEESDIALQYGHVSIVTCLCIYFLFFEILPVNLFIFWGWVGGGGGGGGGGGKGGGGGVIHPTGK